jgi:hypothetical protein
MSHLRLRNRLGLRPEGSPDRGRSIVQLERVTRRDLLSFARLVKSAGEAWGLVSC